MTERDELLAELRASSGGIDPVLDQAADYARGVKAVQGVVRSQGQVMSLALQNNELLYHTNKKLSAQVAHLTEQVDSLGRRLNQRQRDLELARDQIRRLEACGGDRYKELYEATRQALANQLHDAIPEESLGDMLLAMKRQAAEIDAMPAKATVKEMNSDPEPPTMPGREPS